MGMSNTVTVYANRFSGPGTTHEVSFAKTDVEGTYEVIIDGEVAGRIRKAETRHAVTGGTRIAQGYRVQKGWKAVGVRHAVIQDTRAATVYQFIPGAISSWEVK